MTNIHTLLAKELGEVKVKFHESLSHHTASKIGGPAECFIEVDRIDDLIAAVSFAKTHGLKYVIIGSGTTLVFSDNGVEGLVIKNNCRKFEIASVKGKIENRKLQVSEALLFAESGVLLNQLVRFSIEEGYKGLEYFLGLPGTIGGALTQNITTPQGSLSDAVYRVTILTPDGKIEQRDQLTSGISYTILSAIFRLRPGIKSAIWIDANAASSQRSDTSGAIGPVFRDISFADAMRIPTPGNTTSIQWLLSEIGIAGTKCGGIQIVESEPNYLRNLGMGTSEDVTQLIHDVKATVWKRFGVQLREAIRVVQ